MLRKKLSKLIVAVMAAVMLSGGMSGVGQAVFANTSAGVVATQPTDVTNTTEMLNALTANPNVELKVNINGANSNVPVNVDLSDPGIVGAINKRTSPLTIVVQNNSRLIIDKEIKLDGNDSKLKIVRGVNKGGELLNIANGIQPGVVIKNVVFENGDDPTHSAITRTGQDNNVDVELNSNTLTGKGSLVEQKGALTGFKFTNNKLGEGKLLSLQSLKVDFSAVPGSTVITLNGSIKDDQNQTSVNVREKSTATVTVKNSATQKEVFKDSVNLKVTLGNGNRFSEASFSLVATGLEFNTKYTAEVRLDIVDEGGNEYVRNEEVKNVNLKTEGTFSSSAVNVGNNSATINITHGTLPNPNNVTYPLYITLTPNASVNVDPEKIESDTNTVSLTGLAANTSYTYEIKDTAGNVMDRKTFTTTPSTISGGGITGGGSTGGSVVSGDLTTNDINRADIKDVSVSIPVGNTTLANSLRDGRDYKTNIEGVTVTYSNGKVEFTGLVPEKDYRDLTITYTDKDGRTRTVKVSSFKTKVSETKLRQFIVDVYRYSLDRVADERGFAYWEDQLKNKKTSPDEFVKNLLNEPEFINKHTTTTEKVEALYQVIVNRKSDSQGLSFWTKKYDDLVARGYSESMALRVIVDEMVNEQEFKNRVRDLGL